MLGFVSKKQKRQPGPRLDPPCKRRLNMHGICSEHQIPPVFKETPPIPPTEQTTQYTPVSPPQMANQEEKPEQPTMEILTGIIIARQQTQFEYLQGFFYHSYGSDQPFIYTNLRYIYSKFQGRKNNIFLFEDTYGRSSLVKGPVSENEYKMTRTLNDLKLTLPISFIKFRSELPAGLPNLPEGSKIETFYLGQPKINSDLFNKQISDNPLSQNEVVNVICMILKQLDALHTKGYCHYDVSLENIVIDLDDPDGLLCCFIDFAHSFQMVGERKFPEYGKEGYTDPLLTYCNDKNLYLPPWYTEKYPDVYAIGVVIFSIVFGVQPDPADIMEFGVKNYVLRCGLLPFYEGVLELIVSLMDPREGKSIQSSLDIFEKSLIKRI